MLSQFNSDLIMLSVMGLAVFTFLLCFILAIKLRRLRKLTISLEEKSQELAQTINNQRSYTFAFIKRIQTLEDQINKVTDQQEDLEHNLQGNSAYKQALKMAEMGASMEEIISSCDLGPAEAKLLHNLHGYKAVSAKKAI